MPAPFFKVLNDLRDNLTRTILIILSIAVGLFAVGTIASARAILLSEMARSYATIHPSGGVVRTIQPFTEDFVNVVRRMPGVAAADARRTLDMRVQTRSGEWTNIRIFAVPDYDRLSINRVFPGEGAWPPPSHQILIENGAMQVLGVQVGNNVTIETNGQKLRLLRIAGTVHDLAQIPPQLRKDAYGYISFDTLKWFGEVEGYNELDVITTNPADADQAHQVVNAVKDKAEKSGYTIPLTLTLDPGQLPLNDVLQAILLLMGLLSGLALFLSVFLIVNTISALLTQQLRQIGIMKAIGARTPQIMQMYLGLVLLYGCASLLIAAPLAIVGARALSQFMANLFNFDLSHTQIQAQTLELQAAVGLFVPTLAALGPLAGGLRASAAQAMSGRANNQASSRRGWIDRLLSGSNLWFARRFIRRPLLLALRNTFRRKVRLALTLLTLTLGGAIFISVFIVRAEIFVTLEQLFHMYNFDVLVTFQQPHRLDQIKPEAMQVPGVEMTDTWLQIPTRLVHADGSEGNNTYLFATSPGSELMPGPSILQGRWLTPGDENALVVTSFYVKDEPGLQVGQNILLKIDGNERAFHVVGVAIGAGADMAFSSYTYLARLTHQWEASDTLLVRLNRHDPLSVQTAISQLEAHFKYLGYRVSSIRSMQELRSEREGTFDIIVYLLLIMAALLALVGGLGLMGTMSINVLERRREIGVLRTIGASDRDVQLVFMLEGLGIGLLSWILGVILAIPLSQVLSNALGKIMLGEAMPRAYSLSGAWIWLMVVSILSLIANYIPARNAARLTVREVLAYE